MDRKIKYMYITETVSYPTSEMFPFSTDWLFFKFEIYF